MIKIDLLKNHPDAIPALAKILQEELYKGFPEYNAQLTNHWFHEWMNDDLPLAYIALFNDIPVGSCSLQLDDGLRPDLFPWFGDLAVKKEYQKQGIGKMLVDVAALKAKELGFEKLYLFAFDPTIPEYYERLGWKKIGMDEFKSHPVTVMEVEL